MSRLLTLEDLVVDSNLSEEVVSIGNVTIAVITCDDGSYTMETMTEVTHGLRSIEDCLNDLLKKLNVGKSKESTDQPSKLMKFDNKEPCKLRQSFREDFEQSFKTLYPKATMERSSDGGYKESHVEAGWAAYRKSFNIAQIIHRNQLLNKGLVIGKSFLVAGYGDKDTIKKLKVSRHPRFHQKLDKAEAEAQRLANLHGGKFIIYGKIGTAFTKEEAPIKDSDVVTRE